MSDVETTHDQFTIERRYRQSPERVFAAWAVPEKKRRWFAEGEGFTLDSYELDFRVHGMERCRFRAGDGPPMTNDTFFHAIEEGRRIVASYSMTLGGAVFSVSLATVELAGAEGGTLLRYTEQAAFFGRIDGIDSRRAGCTEMLEKLAAALDAAERS
jgi:uncharacterized protein YndB with AHSA1/START domain